MKSGSVEDRLAIRELMETFAAGAMRVDTDLWGSVWADEGSWKLPSMEEAVQGKSNVLVAFKEKMAYVNFMHMSSFPAELVIEGDRAHGKAYSLELIYPREGEKKTVVGCFDDEYVKRGGRWYFVSRVYEVLGME